MPVSVLGTVLIAAVLHAVWHLLSKTARDVSAFMWWGITIGAIWYGVALGSGRSLALPPAVWPIFALSMLAEVGYLSSISAGYTQGDLSQVYPIARGMPPLLVAIWSALFIGERLPVAGYAGVAALILGVYVSSLPAPSDFFKPLAAITNRPAQLALLAALAVSIYTMMDKAAVSQVDPMVYNFWVYLGISVGYAGFVWSGRHRQAALAEIRTNWRWVIVGSLSTVGSYMLALMAMSQTSASYVGAVRATSIVMSALAGSLILREQFGAMRVVSSAVIVAGLACIALAA